MSEIIPGGYNDLTAKGNTLKKWKRPRKRCATQPCDEIPGTAWSHLWCVKHNIERMDGISASLNQITTDFAQRKASAERPDCQPNTGGADG